AMFATASMPFAAITMSEMTDLVRVDTGRIVNGTVAALKGFSNKAGIAIASAVISFVLESTGYIPNAIGQEPEAVITGITLARFAVPALCAVIVIVALIKYPVTQQKREAIRQMYDTIKAEKE
ncbi:MAG: MFS transporter, partial [Clostridia bacterium]|nr:MFS transporter [Clostridia bacterium]